MSMAIISSPEPKGSQGELIDGTRAGLRPLVRPSTLSNMNISETSGPIAIKFYLKHLLGGGKAALGFGPARTGTLVPWLQIAPIRL